jgi:hypothetical protein
VELDGCGAAAYVPEGSFGLDRLVDCWAGISG